MSLKCKVVSHWLTQSACCMLDGVHSVTHAVVVLRISGSERPQVAHVGTYANRESQQLWLMRATVMFVAKLD